MYRLVDVKMFYDQIKSHNFNDISCQIKLSLTDTFYPLNHGNFVIFLRMAMEKFKILMMSIKLKSN